MDCAYNGRPLFLLLTMSRRKRLPQLADLADPATTTAAATSSKTARKKQALALQDLGLALASLADEQRRAIEMPEALREAVEAYRNTRSHEGRRRQLQFVGKLLRGIDPIPLAEAVSRCQSGQSADTERLHAVERWRDALIADDAALTRWMEAHPQTDLPQLRALIRAARSEGAGEALGQRQPKSARLLFRLIRRALETAASG